MRAGTLNWSPGALAAITRKGQREEMTRLFEAYFRVAGEAGRERLVGMLCLSICPRMARAGITSVLSSGGTEAGWFGLN